MNRWPQLTLADRATAMHPPADRDARSSDRSTQQSCCQRHGPVLTELRSLVYARNQRRTAQWPSPNNDPGLAKSEGYGGGVPTPKVTLAFDLAVA